MTPLILLFVAFLQAAQPPAAAPAGNVEAGKRLYDKHTCYFCHGTAGQGGVAGAGVAGVAPHPQSLKPVGRPPPG